MQGKSHLPPSVGAAVTEPPVSWEVGQRVLATASFDGKKRACPFLTVHFAFLRCASNDAHWLLLR